MPRLSAESLYVAIGMLGATVMPHNLYLHSALVQTRSIGRSVAAKRAACRYNLVDSVVALNGALLVNAAILVLAASVFYKRGIVVTEIQQAHLLLAPLLGTTLAGAAFAVALLAAGQSSTFTGTMAGQIVMEGFLNIRMRPWLRRLITRMLAVVPASIVIYLAGDEGTYRLLILSQVILSMQLPFAVIPLIHFTSDGERMGPFASGPWLRFLAWSSATIIVALNIRLAWMGVSGWLAMPGRWRPLVWVAVIAVVAVLAVLLLWVTLEPAIRRWTRTFGRATVNLPEPGNYVAPVYRRILVPLDHTELDRWAVGHAAAMAGTQEAKLYLMHVEEGVTSQVYGKEASTAEVEAGVEYLERIAGALRRQGFEVETAIFHSSDPRKEIVRYAREVRPDLVVMGAHGHGGVKDLIFGSTISPVRHDLDVPLLVVRRPDW